MPQEDWQTRVLQEEIELSIKLAKLNEFIDDAEKFMRLDYESRALLQRQSLYMRDYLNVLRERIALFGKGN